MRELVQDSRETIQTIAVDIVIVGFCLNPVAILCYGKVSGW
jgi:hypothetical protein